MQLTTIQSHANEKSSVKNISTAVAGRISMWAAIACLVFLITLHLLSPEFDPSWRMVSEYALGHYGWILSLMFLSWAISSWSLLLTIKNLIKTKAGKAGLVLLFAASIGQAMAAIFDVTQTFMHGVAALLGIPLFAIAAMLISYSLKKDLLWKGAKPIILWTANFTWISILLVVIAMMILWPG
jgi:hypothetical protein